MESLELKIPPVVVLLIAVIGVYLGSIFDPSYNFFGDTKNSLAWGIFSVGILIGVIGVLTFKRAGTSVHPVNIERTSELVTHGIYALTRNPMYLGMVLIILSLIVRTHSPLGLVWLLAFIWYMTEFQIKPEERMLIKVFPESFAAYMYAVRRWI